MIIKDMYEKEDKFMSAILSQRNVILNIKYKLLNDCNVTNIFNLICDYVSTPEKLTWNQKYFFEKELEDLSTILNKFLRVLLNNESIKELKSEEIIKPCKHFPDDGGEDLMYIISHIPVIDLIIENLKYKKLSNYDEEFVIEQKKRQRENLFNEESFLYKGKFPSKESFKSYDLECEHYKVRNEEYKSYRKDEIEESLKIIIEVFETRKQKIEFGKIFWDNKIKDKIEKELKMKETLSFVMKELAKNSNRK